MLQGYFHYDQCEITTIANTKATIPSGRHPTFELNTDMGGVSIRPAGLSIDIGFGEWQRLQQLGLVRE